MHFVFKVSSCSLVCCLYHSLTDHSLVQSLILQFSSGIFPPGHCHRLISAGGQIARSWPVVAFLRRPPLWAENGRGGICALYRSTHRLVICTFHRREVRRIRKQFQFNGIRSEIMQSDWRILNDMCQSNDGPDIFFLEPFLLVAFFCSRCYYW